MKKHIAYMTAAFLFLSTFGGVASAEETIDEMWGKPVFVYGSALDDDQRKETRKLLGVKGKNKVDEVEITGEDLVNYLSDGNPSARMYSSALIEQTGKGTGVVVQIVTPDNITGVTTYQYANALITAGATDVTVKVASAVKVSGHSALTGVYKAYDEKGEVLDKDRMQVAQEELLLVTELVTENEDKKGFTEEQMNQLLIELKTGLADLVKSKGGQEITDAELDMVVTSAVSKSRLTNEITAEQKARLVAFSRGYVSTDAPLSANVKSQLKSLAVDLTEGIKDGIGKFGEGVVDSAKEKYNKETFWDGVKDFFRTLFDSITGFFKDDAELEGTE